ncbi:MAG: hypothetical protein JWP09_232 [Candidatus Taylorbacteria bacterium]|nr:hypothetical protein [Candidatus Taylorbacteria bacterium]
MSETLGQQALDQHLDRVSTAQEKALQDVENTLHTITAPETALPAIRLSLYNFFIANPDEQAERYNELLNIEIKKLSSLSIKEDEFKKNKKIPPIGVEVEFPSDWLDKSSIDYSELNKMGVNNGPESNHYIELWEVRTSPTFNASTQSKIFEELKQCNLIKDDEHLSMHINLGIPKEINEEKDSHIYETSSTATFINTSTLAFVTADRLINRKSINTYIVNDSSVESVGRKNKFRLELRTHELNDGTAYRAMSNIQLVSVCYFEYIKSITTDKIDEKLINCWQKLNSEFAEIIARYKLPEDELYTLNSDYKELIKILWDRPDIQKEIRFVYSECAREVKDILFPDQDSELE